MGLSYNGAPTPFAEIRAWLDLAGLELSLWEVETLRRLSETYLTELENTREAGSMPAFYTENWLAEIQRRNSEQIRRSMEAARKEQQELKQKNQQQRPRLNRPPMN